MRFLLPIQAWRNGMTERTREYMDDSVLLYRWRRAKKKWQESALQEKFRVRLHRSRHELEFLPAALEIIESPPSPTARFTLRLLMALFAVVLLWSILGRMDVVAVAQGKIIPYGRSKVIQPVETAKILKINVQEGQAVKKGDVLIELDPTDTGADREKTQQALIQTMVEVARLQAVIENPEKPESVFNPPPFAGRLLVETQRHLLQAQSLEYKSHLAAMDANITNVVAQIKTTNVELRKAERTLPLVRQRAEVLTGLADKQLASRSQALQLQQEVVTTQQDIEAQRSRLEELNATLASGRLQREQAISEFQRSRLLELTESEQKVVQLRHELVKAEDKVSRRALTAPEDGFVQALKISSTGGVVTPAQELMYIVPADAPVEVEAVVQNKDRGGIKPGMEAHIKVDAYPYTRYGMLDGVVQSISNDAVNDEKLGPVFTLKATLKNNSLRGLEGEELRVSPGMSVMVEVKSDSRRVIDYLLSPIERGVSEAARER